MSEYTKTALVLGAGDRNSNIDLILENLVWDYFQSLEKIFVRLIIRFVDKLRG